MLVIPQARAIGGGRVLEDGFVKLHRSLLKWEWYDDANTARLFIHLILTANYEDRKWRGVDVKRGQRVISREKLAKELKLSVQSVRTSLNRLISTNEITSESTSRFTIITVKNYDYYQQNNQQDNKQVTSIQQTANHNERKIKKDKKDKEDILSGANAPDQPAAITLTLNDKTEYPVFDSQVSEWAELYPVVDVMQELREMKGWLNANPRKRKTRAGIMRFINSWLAREQDKGGTSGYGRDAPEPPRYKPL